MPSSISVHNLRTCGCRVSTADFHGIAVWEEIGALQHQDLRLNEPAAFEFDPSQGHRERILVRRFGRQQGGRPTGGMDGVSKGGDVDR
jgi:hypothetical protein